MEKSFKRKVSWEKATKLAMNEFEKREAWASHDNISSYSYLDGAYQERYGRDNNPMFLFRAFIGAVKHREAIKQSKEDQYCYPIPYWIIIKLFEVFEKYMKGEKKTYNGKEKPITLDDLLGCRKGQGQKPAIKEDELSQRNLVLMVDMDILRRKRMNIIDAALVTYEHNRGSFSPNARDIRKMYYNKRWKIRLQKVKRYPSRLEKKLLEIAPKALAKKYPDMKSLHKRYPDIFSITHETKVQEIEEERGDHLPYKYWDERNHKLVEFGTPSKFNPTAWKLYKGRSIR